MTINPQIALSAELDPIEFSWQSSDVQLYHLALGAGADPLDPRELRYLADVDPPVLPTFSSVAASFHMTEPPTVRFPGIEIELSRVLHASESVTVAAPLPPSGSARAVTRITGVWDKGKAAVIDNETTVTSADGTPLWITRRSIFARGEGGFGGSAAPRRPPVRPDVPLIWRSTSLPCLARHCCTACAATAIRCTPIPRSPRRPAFPARSCTDCAPTE